MSHKKLSSSVAWGAEQKKPTNIKQSDQIICTFPINIGPGSNAIHCMKPMKIIRYKNLNSIKKYDCSNCLQYIDPGSQFVAACVNERHHVMQCYNVICCKCVETQSQRDIIHNKPINNITALANPECLEEYKNIKELSV